MVDLGAGKVSLTLPTKRRRSAAVEAKDQAKKATMPMKNGGNVVIGLLEEQDVDDATNLIMDLFFKVLT